FEALRDAGIPFLVVGGHAVVLHGYQRNTFDLDLLVSEARLPQAREVLTRLGYQRYFDSGAFLQLTPPTNLPPVDVMIVDDSTFERLERFTESRVLDGETIVIPDPKRLIAMKLHALNASSRQNREKDWDDIVGVIRASGLNVEDPEFLNIIERYGQPGTITELRRRL
ncbi:MAG: nucleotidyltransferase family protein, partial [Verrucomicrobia bacterium]|nr:nucleotidyltransferase family protein [Verrucomicrobiota bacterium]